jgi:hypothetical protein
VPYPAFSTSGLGGQSSDSFGPAQPFMSFDDHVKQLSHYPESPPQSKRPGPNDCPVCGNAADKFVALSPCTHVLCSGCFTSSLNIVGEKTMECAVCREAVESFDMRATSLPSTPSTNSAGSGVSNERLFDSIYGRRQARSSSSSSLSGMPAVSSTVLRIDNVPWVRSSFCYYALFVFLSYVPYS